MLYLTEGDYINAGLSALSIIPGADAFTKTGKASKVLGNGIVESGGVVVGKEKGVFTRGYQIPAGTEVTIVRPKNELGIRIQYSVSQGEDDEIR